MTERFVAKTGSNSNSGAFDSPWLTIGYAAGQISGSDIISVREGIYAESLIDAFPSGSSGARTTLRAYQNELVTMAPASGNFAIGMDSPRSYIDIQRIGVDGGGGMYLSAFNLGDHHHIRFLNCTLRNLLTAGGIQISGAAYIDVIGCLIHDLVHPAVSPFVAHGIYVAAKTQYVYMASNHIYNCSGYGVQLYHDLPAESRPQDCVVIGNRLHNLGAAGVVAYGPRHSLINNLSYQNGTNALLLRAADNCLVFYNTGYNNGLGSTFYSAGDHGIDMQSGSGGVARNNIIWGDGGNPITGFDTADHNLTASDPLFIDAPGGDFRLGVGSPAIGTGADLSSYVTTDFFSRTRTYFDIGAIAFFEGDDAPLPDPTLGTPALVSPVNAEGDVPGSTSLVWTTAPEATTYDVYFGAWPTPPLVAGDVTDTSYDVGPLSDGTYYWRIVAKNDGGSASSATFRFAVGSPAPLPPPPPAALSPVLEETLGRNRTPLFLLDIELSSGTERASSRQVDSPTVTYEPFVVSWGTFETAVPSPVGLPITGDAKFKLAESQMRKWRDLFSHQTPRRRVVKLWTLFEGESLSMRQPDEPRVPFFTGEIVDAIFNGDDRSIEITCRDLTYAWIDEPIPAMITKDIYPGLPDRYEGQFLPIVVGEVRTTEISPPPDIPMNARGQVALPRMGWDDETGDRWGVAAHPCARIIVYRKVELAVDGEQTEEWELVDPGEYTERIIPKTAFNVSMNHHIIDFFVEQPDGTELRADIDGITYRGPWGTLPEVGTPLGGVPYGPFVTALRNPIDFFINMTFFVMRKAGVSGGDGSVFDTADIGALREKFEGLGIKCDGALTKPITCREWLAQFLTSFNVDMWQKRNGKISLNYTDEEDPGRVVYTETRLIIKKTFTERLPVKPINQYQYRYLYNFAEDKFGTWGLLNISEQEVLAIGEEPKIEKEVLDLMFVRDDDTAVAVTTHRAQFQSLGSYTQEWQLPIPEVPVSLEVTSLVGLTHRMGLEIGGYVNREAKVLKIRHDLDRLTSTISSVLRVPQTVVVESPA